MKLKTKLIPIFTIAGTATIVTPLTLTSCGIKIKDTDLLHNQYESKVKQYEPTIFPDEWTRATIYSNIVLENTSILRDDLLWSNSALLHNGKTKAEIDKTIKYTEFNFDIEFSVKRQFAEGMWIDFLCADIDAHVAGTNISESQYLVEHTGSGTEETDYTKIDDFDFHFSASLYGWAGVWPPTAEEISPDPLLEGCQTTLSMTFNGAYVRVMTNGTYSLKDSDQVKKIENHNEWFPTDFEIDTPAERGTSYGWFGSSVLGLYTYATPQSERNAEEQKGQPSTKFISHYMKDATIKEQA